MIFKSMQERGLRYKKIQWLKNSRGQHLVSILEMCLSYIGVPWEKVDLIFQIC